MRRRFAKSWLCTRCFAARRGPGWQQVACLPRILGAKVVRCREVSSPGAASSPIRSSLSAPETAFAFRVENAARMLCVGWVGLPLQRARTRGENSHLRMRIRIHSFIRLSARSLARFIHPFIRPSIPAFGSIQQSRGG